MSFRITGGSARGRILHGRVTDAVRPTSERTREALVSIVGQDLDGMRILDAYAGTGMLGIEAWSRGARVVAVERDRRAETELEKRVEALRADIDIRSGDVLKVVAGLGRFDGILVDPPWDLDPAPILDVLAPLADRWLVLESEDKTEPPAASGGLRAERVRSYGRTKLTVYRRPEVG